MAIHVVTGGAGFIGSHLVTRLLQDGHQVRVVDNLSTGKPQNLAHVIDKIEFFEASILDKAALDQIFQGAECVFHEAALPSVPRSVEAPMETHEQCATGTLTVLIAARDAGVRRVIYAASSSAYGEQEGDFKVETMRPAPISPYGVAKLAAELYCQSFTQVYGLETACLRYFNVFGARQDPQSQYAAVIPLFISAMLQGKSPTIYGDGEQSRDFTYIDNVVHGNILAAYASDAVGQVMNIATGTSVTLLELVAKINRIFDTSIAPLHEAPRSGDIKHSKASIDKARDLLDYSPVVDFDTGLARTAAWYSR